jgi:hypothetical protein
MDDLTIQKLGEKPEHVAEEWERIVELADRGKMWAIWLVASLVANVVFILILAMNAK